jgi:hypothetical protein
MKRNMSAEAFFDISLGLPGERTQEQRIETLAATLEIAIECLRPYDDQRLIELLEQILGENK